METRKCSFLEINRIKGFSDEEKERQKQEALEKILRNKETTVYFKMEEILILFEQS